MSKSKGAEPQDLPQDAVAGREAQQHDLAYDDAGGEPEPGLYPADGVPERKGDITPEAAHPQVEWDERVQPERADERGEPKTGAEADPDIEHQGDE